MQQSVLIVFEANAAAHLHFNACFVPRRHRMSFLAHTIQRAPYLRLPCARCVGEPRIGRRPETADHDPARGATGARDPNFGDIRRSGCIELNLKGRRGPRKEDHRVEPRGPRASRVA
jgi:hypothetical protein